jgi:hypothetical protein
MQIPYFRTYAHNGNVINMNRLIKLIVATHNVNNFRISWLPMANRGPEDQADPHGRWYPSWLDPR